MKLVEVEEFYRYGGDEGCLLYWEDQRTKIRYVQFVKQDECGRYQLGIIEAIADWVDQNPKLTAAVIAGGLALGTFLMVAGQLSLGLASLKMWILGGGVAGQGVLGAFTSLGVGILPIIALVGLFALMLITNFGHIRDHIPQLMWDMVQILADVFEFLVAFVDADFEKVSLSFEKMSFDVYKFTTDALAAIIDFVKGAMAWLNRLFKYMGLAGPYIDENYEKLMTRTTGQQLRAMFAGTTLPEWKRFEEVEYPHMLMTDEELKRNIAMGRTESALSARFDEININVNTPAISSDIDIKRVAEEIGNQFSDVIHNYSNTTTGR